jgi:hypothetical protein
MLFYFFLFVAVIGLLFPQIGSNLLLKGADSRAALLFIRILCALFLIAVFAANYFMIRAQE